MARWRRWRSGEYSTEAVVAGRGGLALSTTPDGWPVVTMKLAGVVASAGSAGWKCGLEVSYRNTPNETPGHVQRGRNQGHSMKTTGKDALRCGGSRYVPSLYGSTPYRPSCQRNSTTQGHQTRCLYSVHCVSPPPSRSHRVLTSPCSSHHHPKPPTAFLNA